MIPPDELLGLSKRLDFPSPTEAVHKALAARVALGLDELVSLAVTRHLGHANWVPGDLVDRAQCCFLPDGRQEWLLDGQPILETWPVELEHASNSVTATRKFRFLTRPLPGTGGAARTS